MSLLPVPIPKLTREQDTWKEEMLQDAFNLQEKKKKPTTRKIKKNLSLKRLIGFTV